MATDTKRTIKISKEAYQALSHQSEKEERSMEEMASAIIVTTLAATQNTSGEQYDPRTGKRIFRG